MYRTEDVGRLSPDGDVDLLGRRDLQVKVRGVRIELGEIEAVLARHRGVRRAVVLLREDVPGDQRLVAYVTAREGDLATTDLRAFAKRILPDEMLPAAFVSLSELPLTRNGKVDRRALPAPARAGHAPAHEPPRTPVETALAEAMAEVLQLDGVGIHDSFFDLGGHSLTAVRLMNRIRDILDVEMSLRQLFETPTVSGLAHAAQVRAAAGAMDPPSTTAPSR
jgi:acyl carrier protein